LLLLPGGGNSDAALLPLSWHDAACRQAILIGVNWFLITAIPARAHPPDRP
jgi:hypothetical protein